MANRNGQGPEGNGPMTGRKAGNCNNNSTENSKTFVRDLGRGAGKPG